MKCPFITLLPVLIALLTQSIHAQVEPLSSGPTTPPTNLTELELNPISLDSIGLTINLPKGSQAETVRIGNSTSTGISLPGGLGTIIINEQRTKDKELTASKAATSIRDKLMATRGAVMIDEQHDLRVGIWTGHRFYIRSPSKDRKDAEIFRGVTIFGHKPNTFLIFDFTLSGSESQFNQARVLYETSIATMNLQGMSSQRLKRAAGFNSTNALFDQITIDDYAKVLTGKNNERWERLFTPANSGDEMDDTEHGYRRIRSWSGYKGELGTKDKSNWTTEDRKLGYLLQIDSMALDAGLRIDSRALFYMSLDGLEETWTIRMTLKGASQAGIDDQSYTQDSAITGARKGGKLVITTVEGNNAPIVISPFIPENGYITQVQSYLIGALIAQKQIQGDFASYSYNPVTNSVTLRWDISEQSPSSPGLWTVTSKTAPATPPSITQFDAQGNLIRVQLNIGRIWEPIELDRLLSLWKRKGLPI